MTSASGLVPPRAARRRAAAFSSGDGAGDPAITRQQRQALFVAALLTAAVGLRSLEAVPGVSMIRPALTLGILGGSVVLARAGTARLTAAMRKPVFLAVAALYGWAALTLPVALSPGAALGSLRGTLPSLILVLVILLVPTAPRAVDYLQRAYILGCAATAIGSLARGVYYDGRLAGVGSLDPNDLAAICSLGAILGLGLVTARRQTSPLSRLAWAAVVALLVAVLTQTGSRGGFLAISVGVASLVSIQTGARRLGLAVIVAVAATVTWQFGPETFRERIGSFVAGETDYNSTDYYGRKQIARRGVGYALENPVAGVGLGNFEVAEGRNCVIQKLTVCRWKAPHNMYVQVAAELGLVGFGLFVAMLVTAVRAAWRIGSPSFQRRFARYARPEFVACLVSYCVSGYFLSHAYLYAALALIAIIQISKEAAARAVQSAQRGTTSSPATLGRDALQEWSPGWIQGRRGGLALGRPGYL